jgi:hypothetical protein
MYEVLHTYPPVKWNRQCTETLVFNPLTPELNPSAQRCLPRFLLEILIFKGLTARRLYKSFGVKGLNYRRRGITQKKAYDIQNKAKV